MKVSRLAIYGPVLVLAALGFSNIVLIFAFFAFILPGLALVAAVNVALYLPFADAVWTGVSTRRWSVAGIGLSLGTVIAGFPVLMGIPTSTEISERTASDMKPGAHRHPPRRLLLQSLGYSEVRLPADEDVPSLSRDENCDELCSWLLISHQVETVLKPSGWGWRSFRGPEHGYSGDAVAYRCLTGPSVVSSGDCFIVAQKVTAPDFDGALVVDAGEMRRIPRFKPFDLGVAQEDRRTAWACERSSCQVVAAKTTLHIRQLAAPLGIGLEGDPGGGLGTHRMLWRRDRFVNKVTTEQFVIDAFGLKPNTARIPRRIG